MGRGQGHRITSALTFAVMGLLAGSLIAASAATAPGPGRRRAVLGADLDARGARADAGVSVPPGVCSVAPDGRLVNCPTVIPKPQQPPGARYGRMLTQPVSDIASLVDTRTWTSGGGNTFPGADVPFGMVQWSPDTMPHRSDGGGYTYGDTSLGGYSLTHVSGPGCRAGGDVPILPVTSALPSGDPNAVTTPFSNSGEVAQAGYYSAQSNQPNTITSEFTATPHSSMGRFTFPATPDAGFLVKLKGSQAGDSADSAQIVSNTEIAGSDTTGHFCGERNNDGQLQRYTVYFDIVFDHPFTASHIITQPGQTDPAAVLLSFDTTSDPVIRAKAGISYVSAANARLNWQTENPGWDFAATRSAAQRSWDELLSRIEVSGGSYAQTQEFYSLLYKAFLQPNITSDVNGQYLGSDFRVHTVNAGQRDQYGMFSGWDIYHSLSQLQAMLDPGAASDMATSLLNYADQNGILQQWGYLNLDNYAMVGDPAQSIIADYYAFGAHGFKLGHALADMLRQATTVNDVRPGEALEQRYGYLPEDGRYGCCHPHGYLPTLLEYDSQDLALAQFAAALGDRRDAAMLERRANNWENVFDPATNLLALRDANGGFVPGITPMTSRHYLEGTAYEYLWNVPNNYPALFSLLGGNAVVAPMLRQYLSQPDGRGMYAELTNEFDFGEQYAPDYAGDPADTQAAVANIRETMYPSGPSLDNNDDLGANSSAFVWEMLGMYPENSGSGNLVFNSPGFPYASISLPDGRTVRIRAPGASPAEYYVAGLTINGAPYDKLYVPYSELAAGATLDWAMSTRPTPWGTAPQDAPPSYPLGMRPVVGYLSSPQITVVPGGTVSVGVGARNATASDQSVRVSASAPAGLAAAATYGTIRVPASGQGSVTLTIHASASAPKGLYRIPVSLSVNGRALPGVTLTVLVAQPGSVMSAFTDAHAEFRRPPYRTPA